MFFEDKNTAVTFLVKNGIPEEDQEFISFVEVLKCQICGKYEDNNLPSLNRHLSQHVNIEKEAKAHNEDEDTYILSLFDGYSID